MIRKLTGLFTLCLVLGGCSPSYEAEYHATVKELEQVKQQLAVAQQKLNTADYEIRSKIYALAQRANKYLKASSLDTDTLDRLMHEMELLSQSYQQFNQRQDLTALTAQFYSQHLNQVLALHQDSQKAYDRQYTDCLSELDSKRDKNNLSSMLCEVQANAAGRESRLKHLAHLSALTTIGDQLLQARLDQTDLSQQQLQLSYRQHVEEWLAKPAE